MNSGSHIALHLCHWGEIVVISKDLQTSSTEEHKQLLSYSGNIICTNKSKIKQPWINLLGSVQPNSSITFSFVKCCVYFRLCNAHWMPTVYKRASFWPLSLSLAVCAKLGACSHNNSTDVTGYRPTRAAFRVSFLARILGLPMDIHAQSWINS